MWTHSLWFPTVGVHREYDCGVQESASRVCTVENNSVGLGGGGEKTTYLSDFLCEQRFLCSQNRM